MIVGSGYDVSLMISWFFLADPTAELKNCVYNIACEVLLWVLDMMFLSRHGWSADPTAEPKVLHYNVGCEV